MLLNINKIITLLLIFILIGCNKKSNIIPETHYINIDVVIVNSNRSDGFTTEKYPKPTIIKQWLVKLLVDTTMFREISSNEECYPLSISDEMWYNHKIGDTLHYDYLIKSKFFKINKNK